MKPNDIKKATQCCFDCDCHNCPYLKKANCEEKLKKELFDLLDQNEKEMSTLLYQPETTISNRKSSKLTMHKIHKE